MPTVRQIAKFAGVSKSTVSLVLNNKAGVSADMRRMVMDAVRQLEALNGVNGRQTAASSDPRRRSANGRSHPLSFVVLHPPTFRSSQVFSEILQGIQTAADRYGIQLRLVANEHAPTEQHVAHLYFQDPQLRPDGILAFGGLQHEPLIEEARRLGIPCVALSRQLGDLTISGLARDEKRQTAAATRYLLELGHQAIAFVGGEKAYSYFHSRLSGFRQAFAAANLVLHEKWIVPGAGDLAISQLLAQTPEVTAVIFINDTYASEGLPVLAAAGRHIPDDVSVISFDNTTIAQEHVPPLTSIAFHFKEEGEWAVRALIDQVQNPAIDQLHITFKSVLIKRDSCAAPHPHRFT